MEVPIGLASQIDKYYLNNWTEHLLSLKQVDNQVLTINRDLPDIFGLESGKPTNFGVFIDGTQVPQPVSKPLTTGVFMEGHSRSLLIGRVIFQDKYGNFYRDLDLKGNGLVMPGLTTSNTPIEVLPVGLRRFEFGRYGLMNLSDAIEEQSKTAFFASLGIRTYQIPATIHLKQILMDGKVTPVEEIIGDSGFMPVSQIRAFGTKARINDADSRTTLGTLYIEDAKKLVAQEFGLKDLESTAYYAVWFGQTLGQQLGLMHKFGWEHGYLTPHNITLDCRIVDLDSLKKITSSAQRVKDYQVGKNSFLTFLSRLDIPYNYSESPGRIIAGMLDQEYMKSLVN